MLLNQITKIVASTIALTLPSMANAMDNPAHLTVLEGWRQADGSHIAAIRLDLDKGWKTYWRAPGDAGIPPFFDFLGSNNLTDFSVDWPAPIVFDQSGLWSVGYKDMVIFPIHIAPRKSNRDVHLKGSIEIGVCKDICVPVSLEIDAVLPADVTQKDPTIGAAMISVPYSRDEAAVKKATCKLTSEVGDLGVTAEIELPATGGKEFVVFETSNEDHWFSPAKSTRKGNILTSHASLVSLSGDTIAISRSDIRMTVLGQDYVVDIQGCTGS